jgi:hypothetical protein
VTRREDTRLPLIRNPLIVVFLFVVFAVAIPAAAIIKPLGGVGSPATIVSVGALVLYCFGRFVPGFLADGFQPIRAMLVAFGCVALVSYAVGQTKGLSVLELSSMDRALISYAGYIGLGLVVTDAVRDRRHLDRVLSFVVLGAGALSVLGIAQFMTGVAPDTWIKIPGLTLQDTDITTLRSTFNRVGATAQHPIEFGVVLAVCLPLSLHYAIHGVGHGRPSRWRWLPVALILIASPMAIARSSVLGLVVGMATIVVAWSGRYRLNALVGSVVMLAAMRAMFPGLLGTLLSMFTFFGNDPSVEGRTQDYPKVLVFFRESPWLGRGPGSFVPSEHFYLDNEYLGTLIGAGVLGVVTLVMVFIVAISLGRGVYHFSADPAARSLGQALAAACAVSMVTWTTYDGLGFRLNSGLAFILFGAVGALWRMEVGRPRWGEEPNHRRPEIQAQAARRSKAREPLVAGASPAGTGLSVHSSTGESP